MDRRAVRLIHRSTRRLLLTEAGRAFHEHCAAMLVKAQAAQAAVKQLQAAPAGTVRMACPATFVQFYLARIASDLTAIKTPANRG